MRQSVCRTDPLPEVGVMVLKLLCAVPGLLLVLGCAPQSSGTSAEPGAEASAQTSPAAEDTAAAADDGATGGGGGAQQVSVDLPGLPIGGSGAVFSTEAPTQCVDVNWTGPPLPDGVALQFTGFHVPPEFTWDSTPCSEAPCVGGGFRVTAGSGGCTVSVTWAGQPLADPDHSVLNADAEAWCVDETVCEDVKTASDALSQQTGGASSIGLSVAESGPSATSDSGG